MILAHLTERQKAILAEFLRTGSQKITALNLFVTPSTVGSTLLRIRRAAGIKSNKHLFAMSAGGDKPAAELCALRAEMAGMRQQVVALQEQLSLVCSQRDAALAKLAEIEVHRSLTKSS